MADEPYIYRLPTEILLQIAGYLGATKDQPLRLQDLCRVSKKLLPIAQSELYANAYLPFTCGCHPCVNPAVQLLRTLLQRPDLAAKVKALRFFATNQTITKLYKQKNFRLKSLRDECLWRLTEYGYTSKLDNPWRRCLLNDVESAYVGVLLTLLPNLETLRFQVRETIQGYPSIEPLPAFFGSPVSYPMLANLQKTVKHVGISDIGFLRDTRFKTLKSLDLSYVDWQTLVRMQGPHTIKSAKSIESLCISMSIYVMEDYTNHGTGLSLRSLLEALDCYNVKSLSIKLRDQGEPQGSGEIFDSGELMRSIGVVAARLEKLDIDCDTNQDDHDWEMFLLNCQDPILSFDKFPSLKQLRIPQQLLFTHDHEFGEEVGVQLGELPEKLEHLEILYPDISILEWLEDFTRLEQYSRQRRSLKVLYLQCREDVMIESSAFTASPHPVWSKLPDYGVKCFISEDIDKQARDLEIMFSDHQKGGGDQDEDEDEHDEDEDDEEKSDGSNSDMGMEQGDESKAKTPSLYDPKVADMD
ncbi:hypothetical protein DM02DRAFT_586823 [Periconia macrospinosa]|uniref:Uncharacterized protein n=1 Tax=Periconia macrospinosa TaxID=97972 RepID=A0A2V1E179_9PLEO|nr:hypothetical protein DM02DRAFT_586823 [Periconia macrospinosa]